MSAAAVAAPRFKKRRRPIPTAQLGPTQTGYVFEKSESTADAHRLNEQSQQQQQAPAKNTSPAEELPLSRPSPTFWETACRELGMTHSKSKSRSPAAAGGAGGHEAMVSPLGGDASKGFHTASTESEPWIELDLHQLSLEAIVEKRLRHEDAENQEPTQQQQQQQHEEEKQEHPEGDGHAAASLAHMQSDSQEDDAEEDVQETQLPAATQRSVSGEEEVKEEEEEEPSPSLWPIRLSGMPELPVASTPSASQPSPKEAELEDSGQAVFKDLLVIITGFNEESSRSQRRNEATQVKELLKRHGATILEDIEDLQLDGTLRGSSSSNPSDSPKRFPLTLAIADQPRRTVKYLFALAAGVPIVGAEWVRDSADKGQLQPLAPYVLRRAEGECRGAPLDFARGVKPPIHEHGLAPIPPPLSRKDRLFTGFEVALVGSPSFCSQFSWLLSQCGADVVPASRRDSLRVRSGRYRDGARVRMSAGWRTRRPRRPRQLWRMVVHEQKDGAAERGKEEDGSRGSDYMRSEETMQADGSMLCRSHVESDWIVACIIHGTHVNRSHHCSAYP